jgi:pSer/pThr/pTyr-binding forkhead associated (FHA) protein
VTDPSVPQLFIRPDACHSPQGLIDSGFWSPLMWMTRSPSSLPAGYYYGLVGKKFWTIGSGIDCTIVLPDIHISSQHALLLTTAHREIYLSDLQSVNGSFVNGQQVHHPVLLNHGDLLKIGSFEIEFQNSSKLSAEKISNRQKLVLLLQTSNFQGNIWQEILNAGEISVAYKNFSDPNLHENIETIIKSLERFPDLLVADVEILKPNAYEFCRWCRDYYPGLKIILISNSRTEIFSSERRWAINQGAIDLLLGFSEDSFFSTELTDVIARVDCILQALEVPTSTLSSLEPVLRSLMQRFRH